MSLALKKKNAAVRDDKLEYKQSFYNFFLFPSRGYKRKAKISSYHKNVFTAKLQKSPLWAESQVQEQTE